MLDNPKNRAQLQKVFPRLATTPFTVTSEAAPQYNCVAFAVGITDQRWWPHTNQKGWHWPTTAPQEETLAAFEAVLRELGWEVCSAGSLESGYEKLAIFANGNMMPTHIARQIATGSWVSKLGTWLDIEHTNCQGLTGDEYGEVAMYMRRAVPPDPAGTLTP